MGGLTSYQVLVRLNARFSEKNHPEIDALRPLDLPYPAHVQSRDGHNTKTEIHTYSEYT